MASTGHCVVLVTGGSGFLGQHLIGLLQTRAPHVTEIRVLDLPSNPYVNKLGKSNRGVKQIQHALVLCAVTAVDQCPFIDACIYILQSAQR